MTRARQRVTVVSSIRANDIDASPERPAGVRNVPLERITPNPQQPRMNFDEAALAEALLAGRIAGAGLDVWEDEPPPSDHPLLQFDNVLVSPHTAGITRQSRAG